MIFQIMKEHWRIEELCLKHYTFVLVCLIHDNILYNIYIYNCMVTYIYICIIYIYTVLRCALSSWCFIKNTGLASSGGRAAEPMRRTALTFATCWTTASCPRPVPRHQFRGWRLIQQVNHGKPLPIGSMYGIYANIGGIWMVNVTIYSIHGSYGLPEDTSLGDKDVKNDAFSHFLAISYLSG